MRILKMTLGTLSLLIFITYFSMAAPMVQQKKIAPSDEMIIQSAPSSKAQKKLNFIQKFILKKVERKTKKASDEDDYRKWARKSVIFGAFAFLGIPGFFS